MKSITVLFCILLSAQLYAQSMFDKFEDSDDIGSVTINRGMLDIAAAMMAKSDDEDSKEFAEIVENINSIKVFISEDEVASDQMQAAMAEYAKSSALEELMKVKDDDTFLRFYIKNGKNGNRIEELLMFMTGIDHQKKGKDAPYFETVLLTMTGEIDLSKVGTLTDKMKLPHQLKRASKAKN
ncbi:MAG: DUF4252 domain-containing protein [Bacteroidota bacterium]